MPTNYRAPRELLLRVGFIPQTGDTYSHPSLLCETCQLGPDSSHCWTTGVDIAREDSGGGLIVGPCTRCRHKKLACTLRKRRVQRVHHHLSISPIPSSSSVPLTAPITRLVYGKRLGRIEQRPTHDWVSPVFAHTPGGGPSKPIIRFLPCNSTWAILDALDRKLPRVELELSDGLSKALQAYRRSLSDDVEDDVDQSEPVGDDEDEWETDLFDPGDDGCSSPRDTRSESGCTSWRRDRLTDEDVYRDGRDLEEELSDPGQLRSALDDFFDNDDGIGFEHFQYLQESMGFETLHEAEAAMASWTPSPKHITVHTPPRSRLASLSSTVSSPRVPLHPTHEPLITPADAPSSPAAAIKIVAPTPTLRSKPHLAPQQILAFHLRYLKAEQEMAAELGLEASVDDVSWPDKGVAPLDDGWAVINKVRDLVQILRNRRQQKLCEDLGGMIDF